ncbi:myotrophin-like [Ornithodoros turicata]|uniref:myotrophin-like n=1 Tax=Ornithodoros turicata TaxID=34597 RepID=UPI003138948F
MSGFLWSVKIGDLEQVKDCLEHKGIDVNEAIDGRPPLHHAADYGQTEVVRFLIDSGADVNAKDKYGISALLAAIWEGHTACVKLMLEKGAHKDGTTPEGVSYMEAAEKPEIKDLLRS